MEYQNAIMRAKIQNVIKNRNSSVWGSRNRRFYVFVVFKRLVGCLRCAHSRSTPCRKTTALLTTAQCRSEALAQFLRTNNLGANVTPVREPQWLEPAGPCGVQVRGSLVLVAEPAYRHNHDRSANAGSGGAATVADNKARTSR